MEERIVKNKRVSICNMCGKKIITDYKVKYKKYSSEKKVKHYHLSCYLNSILGITRRYKEALTELNKSKRKLNKYKRHIMLENL